MECSRDQFQELGCYIGLDCFIVRWVKPDGFALSFALLLLVLVRSWRIELKRAVKATVSQRLCIVGLVGIKHLLITGQRGETALYHFGELFDDRRRVIGLSVYVQGEVVGLSEWSMLSAGEAEEVFLQRFFC